MTRSLILIALCPLLWWAAGANAFRNCDVSESYAWSASTHYTVGEIAFDGITGTASGTETRYNFSNHATAGSGECHVTYELSGTYDAVVEVFTLDATRSNYSDSCPPELLGAQYPPSRLYALQMAFSEDGSARVSSAASGQLLASGSWESGRAVYKTPEECEIF
jgi:hypothetical protein